MLVRTCRVMHNRAAICMDFFISVSIAAILHKVAVNLRHRDM